MNPVLLKDLAILCPIAFVAGAVNSVAGGGTLLTFPALVWAGMPAIRANATSTVALVPGSASGFWAYRDEIERGMAPLVWLGLPSLAGGVVGALLVLQAGETLFRHLVPWLILGATLLFMAQEPISLWMRRRVSSSVGEEDQAGRSPIEHPRGLPLVAIMLYQFVVAIYGGFFGAGIGILMLAALGLLGLTNIHRMNGLKNMAAVFINSVAAITFVAGHRVEWMLALPMAVASIAGAYASAGVARRLSQKTVRRIVVGIGLAIAVLMFARGV